MERKSDVILSVIIPVYNAEKYVKQCLDSLPNSDECEIIVVNDGSTDQTDNLVSEVCRYNLNIRYFKKKNEGVSAARNFGLNQARGKYVTFLDADDMLNKECIFKWMSDLDKEQSADNIYIFNYRDIDVNGEKLSEHRLSEVMYDKDTVCRQFVGGFLLNACWGKIYSRNTILEHKIVFDEKMKIGEDLVFVADYLEMVKHFFVIDEVIYSYRQTENGVMNATRHFLNEQRIKDYEKMFTKKQEYLLKSQTSEEVWNIFYAKCAEEMIAELNIMMQSKRGFIVEYQEMTNFLANQSINSILNKAGRIAGQTKSRKLAIYLLKYKTLRKLYFILKYVEYMR